MTELDAGLVRRKLAVIVRNLAVLAQAAAVHGVRGSSRVVADRGGAVTAITIILASTAAITVVVTR